MNRLRGVNFDLLKSKVVLIVTGGVIVLLIVWWFAWMTPEGSKLTSVQQQVSTDTATKQQLSLEIQSLIKEKKLVLKELPFLKQVTTAIPPIQDPGGIINELYALATKTHCDLLSVVPSDAPSPSGTVGLSEIPVSFSLSGTHKNVFVFLTDFYTLKRLMTISTVSLAPGSNNPNILAVGDGQTYNLTVTADAYTTYLAAGATA